MATFDVPGSYLQSDMPKYKRVWMNARGYFFDIMYQVNPEYEQQGRYENWIFFVSIIAQGDLWLHQVCIVMVLSIFYNDVDFVF